MIDHIGLRTAQFERSKTFYTHALAPLGITPQVEYPGGVGYGRAGVPMFWIGQSEQAPSSMHLALTAPDPAAVRAFYQAALAAGASDNGAPGLRPDYHARYYAAFVIDPDGNNIEAVCHAA
ncbi:VOC family protein [Hylemonella gracilis]|uniref:VOC family protein n=1 Tax=Hylemonella gracilis TaxID=80880 RepID=A0A4P6UP61_9BURK|nr:VOC family protein [Hylemonella gracilis]QBK05915.1 VOC family protein [Hylemonella gracilis]